MSLDSRYRVFYRNMMATDRGFRRLLYTSTPVSRDLDADRTSIIGASQPANGVDGITGALWSSAEFYVQVLEGAPDAVDDTFSRIEADPRHQDIEVLSDTMEADRCFGAWAMANGWDSALPVITDRLCDLVLKSGHASAAALAANIRG